MEEVLVLLNQIKEAMEARLSALEDAVRSLGASLPTSPREDPPKLQAYDLPELPSDRVHQDGVTINPDGSIWTYAEETGPVRTHFGYISPIKTPEIFGAATKLFGNDKFYERWKKNPYGIYKADVRDLISSGVINFRSFDELVVPVTTYRQ